jgi:hypothetical protein
VLDDYVVEESAVRVIDELDLEMLRFKTAPAELGITPR